MLWGKLWYFISLSENLILHLIFNDYFGQYWKYRKIPRNLKVYIKCQILNCLEFNEFWTLQQKIVFFCRIVRKNISTFGFRFWHIRTKLVVTSMDITFYTNYYEPILKIMPYARKDVVLTSSTNRQTNHPAAWNYHSWKTLLTKFQKHNPLYTMCFSI